MRRICVLLLMATVLAGGAGGARAEEQVRVYRDGKGVPHIFADTAPAVLFGLSYAIAQDRLAQLELRRRGVQGRRAEILGPSALEGDRVSLDRALSPAELLRMYRALPAEYQAMMQAYVDGINRHVDEALASPETKLPYEFGQWGVLPQRWTLLDYLGFIASMPGDRSSEELHNAAFLQAMVDRHGAAQGRDIFEDVVPISDPDTPTIIPPGEDIAPAQSLPVPGTLFRPRPGGPVAARPSPLPRQASRCLVIGPERSASGHVLMLQATADGPEMHLHGGGFDTAGFSSLGWGPPIMGRSARHGWYLTSGEADATDIFEEVLNPADRYQYRFNGQWRRMTRTTSMIPVKGQAPVAHEVARTIHGTVVQWDAKNGVAYSERYAGRGRELDNWVAMVEMARARDLAGFEQNGVARLGWNLGICYGDTAGQVAFWEAGSLPRRAPGADSRLPTPGTGEYEWRGFLDFAEHPRLRNPKQGFLYLWNSKATSWSQEGDGARMGKTFRTWSGIDLAAANSSVTLLDLRELNRKINNALGGTDRTHTKPAFFAPALTSALARNSDPEIAEAAGLMLAFDGYYEDADKDGYYDAPGLPIFREWLAVAPQTVFGPAMDDWWTRIDAGRYLQYQTSLLWRALAGDDAGLTLKHDYLRGRNRDALILETLKQAVHNLKARYGDTPMVNWRQPIFWKYFDASKQAPDKPAMPDPDARPDRLSARLGLDVAAVPHHGGDEWTAMMELSPDAEPKIYTITDTGGQNRFIDQSGRGNPHLSDQTWMHADNEFKTIEMAPGKVVAVAESVETLVYVPGRR
jgi:acyl-homoserine lactone acylase PvdQ